MFKLLDSNWKSAFGDAIPSHPCELKIVCPFIKVKALQGLLSLGKYSSISVLTRLSEQDAFNGVTDLEALELLLDIRASVRGIRNLHSKLFVFGGSSAIVGSANLTNAAWQRNHELGFIATQPEVVCGCNDYFKKLWSQTSIDLTANILARMQKSVSNAKRIQFPGPNHQFIDYGEVIATSDKEADFSRLPGRSFIKFFGQGDDRISRETPVIKEIGESGSNYACTYPKGRRPRTVRDGDVMFLGHFVSDPDDLIIYGRAIAVAHVDSRDDASEKERGHRHWKENWPHYVRIHSPEFVAGALKNGVSMRDLEKTLGPFAYRASSERVRLGNAEVRATSAYRQQPQVELTPAGWAWITEQFNRSLAANGRLGAEELDMLYWPESIVE